MRRLLSLTLLLWFGMLPAAPMLALAPSGEAGLALCCRKGGMHHCMAMDAQQGPALRAACPFAGTQPATTTHVPGAAVLPVVRGQGADHHGALRTMESQTGAAAWFWVGSSRGPPAGGRCSLPAFSFQLEFLAVSF